MVTPESSWKCLVSWMILPPSSSTAAWRSISKVTARSTERSEFDVLRLGPGARAAGAARRQRRVHVAAQRCLFHPDIRDAERAHQIPQLRHVAAGDGRRQSTGALDRLGDDLHQRDAGPVVVDERVLGAVNPAGRAADVQRLAGVFFQVHPLDGDPELTAVHRDVEPALGAQRLVVLGDLEVLRHVRIEVVLPGEPAPGGDRAVQRQADPDRVLDRHPRLPRAASRAVPGRRGTPGCSARRRTRCCSRRTSWSWYPARRASPSRSAARSGRARRRTGPACPSSSFPKSLRPVEHAVAPAVGKRRLRGGGHPV